MLANLITTALLTLIVSALMSALLLYSTTDSVLASTQERWQIANGLFLCLTALSGFVLVVLMYIAIWT